MTTFDTWVNKSTQWFIDENPIEGGVSLVRYSRVSTPEGGWRESDPQTLDAQPARLVHSTRVSNEQAVTLPDGQVVFTEKTLVMLKGADVQIGDEFTYEGDTWKILSVGGRYATDASAYRHSGG